MAFVYPYYINPCDESLPVSGQKKMDSKKEASVCDNLQAMRVQLRCSLCVRSS